MTGPSVEVLTDTSIPDDARVAAAGEGGRVLAPESPLGKALCVVALDHEDRGDVRTAAVRAIADTPAAAPNQLVRVPGGVGRTPVRAEAVAVLRELGTAPVMATRFDEQPRAPAGPDRAITLANLPSSYGYDVRIVATYDAALDDTDEGGRERVARPSQGTSAGRERPRAAAGHHAATVLRRVPASLEWVPTPDPVHRCRPARSARATRRTQTPCPVAETRVRIMHRNYRWLHPRRADPGLRASALATRCVPRSRTVHTAPQRHRSLRSGRRAPLRNLGPAPNPRSARSASSPPLATGASSDVHRPEHCVSTGWRVRDALAA